MGPSSPAQDPSTQQGAGHERIPERVRIAVTGASGHLGTSVLTALGADPAVDEIIGIARRPPQQQAGKVRWVAADMATDDLRTAFANTDVMIHLAWLIQPSRDPTGIGVRDR